MRRGLGAMVLVLALSAGARADGAFPDSFALFAPADQPSVLRLATNFGLVVSSDDAHSWSYVCENAIISFASLYSQGPDDALYAVSTLGLVSSRNGGCSFTVAQGSLALSAVTDVFADPSDGMHVLAIASVVGDAGVAGNTRLYESHDGGLSFGDALYNPDPGQVLTGVEIARSDPRTIYLTMYQTGPHPYVARSNDAGAHFTVLDESAVGQRFPRLLAVDPANPQRLFLRLGGTDGDALGISEDGGVTVQLPLTVPAQMTAFLLRADGTILLGDNNGMSWRSTAVDGGAAASFADWPIGLHLRGLAERGTRLYAVGDDVIDDAALSFSDDEAHFTTILHFRDILGPLACGNVASTCAVPWLQLEPTINPTYDAGAPDLSPVVKSGGGGCGCGLAPGSVGLLPFVCVLLCGLLARRSRT